MTAQDRPDADEDDRPIRAIVVDDDALARRMVKDTLQRAGIVVVAEGEDGRAGVELTMFYRPDVVLMDVVMPELDGIAALREIIDRAPDQLVIMLTGSKDEDLGLIGLRAGAAGHLTKDLEIDSLPRVIASALAGEAAISRQMTMRLVEHLRQIPEHAVGVRPVKSRLTSREWEVLDLLAERLTNDEIAQRLVLSPETVRTHLKNIFRKLEVSSREEAVEAAGRMRIFGDPD